MDEFRELTRPETLADHDVRVIRGGGYIGNDLREQRTRRPTRPITQKEVTK